MDVAVGEPAARLVTAEGGVTSGGRLVVALAILEIVDQFDTSSAVFKAKY